MKTKKNCCTSCQRSGSALLIVLIISTIMFIVTGGLCAYAVGTIQQVRQMTDNIRAKAIAEAGANEAYSRLSVPTDYYSLRDNAAAFPTTDFAGGSYQIILEAEPHGRTRLVSVGRFGIAEQSVSLHLWDANVPPRYFGYAIFANGDINFNGKPRLIEGDAHSNQIWILGNNALNLYGNINGLIGAQNQDDIPSSHRMEWDWEEIPFPSLSDVEFQEFLAAADAAGELTTMDGRPLGGNDKLIINGVGVVHGNLTVNGGAQLSVNGLLYVTGNVTSNGSGDIDIVGTILAGGNVRLNGSSSSFQYHYVPSRYLDTDIATVMVSAWYD